MGHCFATYHKLTPICLTLQHTTKKIKKAMIEEAILRYLKKNKKKSIDPKAVLFDMDGVLYDSMKFHAKAWKEVADEYKLDSTMEDFYMFEGCTGFYTINELHKRTFKRASTEEEIKEIYTKKSNLFSKYNDGEYMKGSVEVLAKVKDYKLDCLVVTGSGQHSLIDKLESSFPGCFSRQKMVTAYDVKHGKPHPEPYLMGLSKAGVDTHEAFVIENAPRGVESGVAAGIFTIAVNTGPLHNDVLLSSGADILFPDMKTLSESWDEIMKVASEVSFIQ